MTVQPHQQDRLYLLFWWLLAIVPGLFFAPAGVVGAVVAAIGCRRFRVAFIVIAVLWLLVTVFLTPVGGSGEGSGGRS